MGAQLRDRPLHDEPEPLSELLDDVAWAAFSGGFAVGLAMPGLPAPVGTVQTASHLVWDLPPVDLEARNEKALSLMGMEGRPGARLLPQRVVHADPPDARWSRRWRR